MANLQTDLGNAIAATIAAASSAFTALGSTGATLHVEYRGQPNRYGDGRLGKCLVRPAQPSAVPGGDYAESGLTSFVFELEFSLLDRRSGGNARDVIHQAVHSTFRARGASLWAQFTDNGSNRLGGSGTVVVGDVSESTPEDADRPVFVVSLAVTLWHKVPLA